MEPIFLQRCVLNIIKFENLKKTVCILFFMIVLTIITIDRYSPMHRYFVMFAQKLCVTYFDLRSDQHLRKYHCWQD